MIILRLRQTWRLHMNGFICIRWSRITLTGQDYVTVNRPIRARKGLRAVTCTWSSWRSFPFSEVMTCSCNLHWADSSSAFLLRDCSSSRDLHTKHHVTMATGSYSEGRQKHQRVQKMPFYCLQNLYFYCWEKILLVILAFIDNDYCETKLLVFNDCFY